MLLIKKNFPTLLVGIQIGAATLEKNTEVKKLKNRTTILSFNLAPGHISGKDKNSNSKR